MHISSISSLRDYESIKPIGVLLFRGHSSYKAMHFSNKSFGTGWPIKTVEPIEPSIRPLIIHVLLFRWRTQRELHQNYIYDLKLHSVFGKDIVYRLFYTLYDATGTQLIQATFNYLFIVTNIRTTIHLELSLCLQQIQLSNFNERNKKIMEYTPRAFILMQTSNWFSDHRWCTWKVSDEMQILWTLAQLFLCVLRAVSYELGKWTG